MGPLDGLLVLDLTHGVAGPFATMILGDLGCEVIKVEKPGRGDNTRYMNVSDRFVSDIPTTGGDYFIAINRNKRSLTLDLKTEAGLDIAKRLAAKADLVVQNFSPGVIEKLGLGYDVLGKENDRLIYANVSAYGNAGPLATHPGMDLTVQARSGVMTMTGSRTAGAGPVEPIKPGVSLADFAGGSHLVIGVLGALLARERTGRGQQLSVSLLDATMAMLINYSVATMDGGADLKPMGSGHPQIAPYQAFATQDGHIVLGPGTNSLYRRLCACLGLDHLTTDERYRNNPLRVEHRAELIPEFEAVLSKRTTAEWVAFFEEQRIPCAPVNTMRQAFAEPQLIANGMIEEVPHPTLGSVHLLGSPYKYADSGSVTRRPPPMLGEHTAEILTGLLGMDTASVGRLESQGVISVLSNADNSPEKGEQ